MGDYRSKKEEIQKEFVRREENWIFMEESILKRERLIVQFIVQRLSEMKIEMVVGFGNKGGYGLF